MDERSNKNNEEASVEKKDDFEIKEAPKKESSIRTYAGDISNLIRKGVSLSDVALSEQKRNLEKGSGSKLINERKESQKKNKKIIVGSLVFIILGLLVIGGSFIFKKEDKIINNLEIIPLISSNSSQELSLEGLDRIEIFKKINQNRLSVQNVLGSVTNLVITDGSEENKILVSTSNFFEKIDVRARQSFVRALGDKFMLGIHSFDGNQGFFVFEIKSFENALSGILDWENLMLDDFWPMLYEERPKTRVEEEGGIAREESFEDIIIKNKDTRVLKDIDGNFILVYSFPDRKHLIIATKESTMIEAIDRLTRSRAQN